MNTGKETISFTCPSCGHTTKPRAAVRELIQGRRLACEKCGTEIPIDPEAFRNVERILERLGVEHTPFLSVEAATTVAVRCPHCDATAAVPMSLAELGERSRVLCQSCGKEIPIDREKIQRAQGVLRRLEADGPDGTKTFESADGPVVVETKTFNVDVNGDIGGQPRPAAAPPGPSGPAALGPKRGCLGVMAALGVPALLILSAAAVLA